MKTKNKRNYLREDGITLIALVVTIVVLLILAGVSINALFGNNGIIEKAKEAQNAMDKATENDREEIGKLTNWLDNQINGTTGGTTGGDDTSTTQKISTLVGTVVDKNTKAEDAYGNKITIPSGFKILVDSTTGYTKDNIDVTKGIVVEDENGNQFVWVPVGTIKNAEKTQTITLGRYSNFVKTNNVYTPIQSAENYATATSVNNFTEYTPENHNKKFNITIAKNIGEFCNKAIESGGYYIGRYEARTGVERTSSSTTLTPVTSKADDYVYKYATQLQASERCQSMYTNKPFDSDLINGYAWDTAIIFIQEFGGDILEKGYSYFGDNGGATYSNAVPVNSSIASKGTSGSNYTGTRDVMCNIYDMASNSMEYSTEATWDDDNPYTARGGNSADQYNSVYCAGRRNMGSRIGTAFRPILYM